MLPMLHLPGTDLRVSAICYGAVPFGTVVTGEALDRLFGTFLDAGGNFFDTAHCYCFWLPNGDGTSERTLGALVRRFCARDRVVIATKGGHPAVPPAYPRPDAYISPARVAADVDESLARLGMDQVDLYYLHRDDERLPAGEIIEMLNAEVQAGRVRYLGASNWRAERIAEANAYAAAHGLRGFAVSQPQFSLAQFNAGVGDPTLRPLAGDDLRWHRATGFPAVAYTSTAGGYFAGNLNADAVFDNPVSRERRERARRLAAALGCTPNQVALSALLHLDFTVIPAIGTANPAHLADALAAPAVRLTRAQVEALWT